MGSPTSPTSDPNQTAREQFDIQRNWLLNPLPPSRSVCAVCRGVRDRGFVRCYPCNQISRRSGGLVADAVVPISYSPDNGQHYYQLKAYKSPTSPNALAQYRLAVLYTVFMGRHRLCLERAAGGPFTHTATVPSTRARPGVHPLQQIADLTSPDLALVAGAANLAYGNAREFVPDRFHVPRLDHASPRVLLIDDLWVTGARVQAMAHALKKAGAVSVVAVTLGRQINHDHAPSRPLLDAVRGQAFDVERCALDDPSG